MEQPVSDPSAGSRPRRRDRRDRGMRGPGVLPRRPGTPETRTPAERFDDLVLAAVADLEERWADRLGLVEYAVEEVPTLADDWTPTSVPLSALVRGSGANTTRVVLFRRPLEHRAESHQDLQALVLTVLVEQVAELLGMPPESVHPRYPAD